MRYCVQNSETGESFYVGEASSPRNQHIDEETGEPLSDKVKVRYTKHKNFQIPKQYLRGTTFEEFEKVMLHEDEHSYQPIGSITVTPIRKDQEANIERKRLKHAANNLHKRYKREDYMNMEGVQNDIILGYNKLGYVLYLIPSLLFFNVYLAVVITFMEVLLHIWAHRKNNFNMSRNHYYRSPLHILTSQYCAICRAESDDDLRVFHMLNKQMRHGRNAQALKDITKAIS